MADVRTVRLELLRHGPAHNQLLSPLTQYLALCGDRSAESVTVPFEHQQFLKRVRPLYYESSEEDRRYWLSDMARTMAEILGDLRTLTAELGECRGDGDDIVDLRLVLSSSELALLPWELADTPDAWAGAGQPLALQGQFPLTITRQVRRVGSPHFVWPTKPKILFAAAAPPGVAPVPAKSHLLALRQCIDPWVKYPPGRGREDVRPAVEEHLVFLPDASINKIQRACEQGEFTHVHLLAHGLPQRESSDPSFGIALHRDGDASKADVVDGQRLAAALGPYAPDGARRALPAVVTLASCNAGNVGSVVGAGASVAHALHENGVPFVVASQFPLTFPGSVIMAQKLYERFLWGHDPWSALRELRQTLKASVPAAHDWASIVAYGDLSPGPAMDLSGVQYKQAHRSHDAALFAVDSTVKAISGPGADGPDPQHRAERLDEARARVVMSLRRLEKLPRHDAEAVGYLGSAYKREAEALFLASQALASSDEAAAERNQAESRRVLSTATEKYREATWIGLTNHWVVSQYLVLATLLGQEVDSFEDLWSAARVAAQRDLGSTDGKTVAWAHGSLAELYLLTAVEPLGDGPADALEGTLEHVRQLVKAARAANYEFAVQSTQRQFDRYASWFFHIAEDPTFEERLGPIVSEVVKQFPGDPEAVRHVSPF